jgi:hypothetical protein
MLYLTTFRSNVFHIGSYPISMKREVLLAVKFKQRYHLGCHVRWVPCHHSMARPQVADEGDGL